MKIPCNKKIKLYNKLRANYKKPLALKLWIFGLKLTKYFPNGNMKII